MEFFGYIGSICLAICALPQAMLSYKRGHSKGIAFNFLLLWTVGEVFTLIYVFPKLDIPLILNYSANLVFLSIIWRYKIFPKTFF
jgi:uncharacterized protein with PQ loop repeat